MKKILVLIAFFATIISVNADYSKVTVTNMDEPMMCTMEYAPVCWEVQTQCLFWECDKIYQTFWNMCWLKQNKNAKFLYEGQCSDEWAIVPKENNTTPTKACTREYMPVCGQPKMPECPEGMMCAQVMPAPQTYSNKCVMESLWAEFISEWTCEAKIEDEPMMCTMDYTPVCGKNWVTYWNKCMAWKQEISYTWECVSQKNQEKLTNQLDKIIYNLENKNPTKVVPILENAVKNVDKITANQKMSEKKLNIFRFIKNYLQDYLNK